MPPSLIALFLAAFAFGTTEFVIAGVLPQVADGLAVSIPTAGYLVSGYALGIAIGGPLLTLATARLSRKTLLVGLTVAFIAGQLACALAPDFTSMLTIRVLVAIAHGAYFGVAMVVGTSVVREDQRGTAVAIILAGLTVSNIIGVPAGAAIGNAFGWRATFWAMLLLGVLALVAMLALLPRANGAAQEQPSIGSQVKVLARQQAWTSLILMLLLMVCQFVPYTYIAPLLREVTGVSPELIPALLLVIGVGSTAGVFVGGRLAGANAMNWLVALCILQAAVLALFWAAAPYPWPTGVVLTIWGGVNFAIGTLIQTRILTWTADAPGLASSLIPSGFNFGIASAAFIGAMMLNAGWGYRSLPLLGVLAMIVAAVVATLSATGERRAGLTPPVPATV
jgi:DHA1 family inner membrane transport protein